MRWDDIVVCVENSNRDYERYVDEDDDHNGSNYGPSIAIWAPGTDITSTQPGNQMASLTGTSMSAPAVAAIFAIFIGHEGLNNDVSVPINRLRQNRIANVVTGVPNTVAFFANNGINNPTKDPTRPYLGAPIGGNGNALEQTVAEDSELRSDSAILHMSNERVTYNTNRRGHDTCPRSRFSGTSFVIRRGEFTM